tara:strand:- start:2298 stop:3713 length:1416 start_codon:yes stop_codon:yes gene_type:complete
MRHIIGEDRDQTTLLPDSLEDFVAQDHPVRVIDAFIDTLPLAELGFTKAETKITGRKPYHPGDLLKLYVYGYLNQVRTSRRLERECHRNLEVLWLIRRLTPDFKTIADFRRDNGAAVRGACRAFIQFCRSAGLLNGRLIGIDGSKFKAAASKDQALTRRQLERDRKLIDEKIERYLEQLDEADSADRGEGLERDKVHDALEKLKEKARRLDEREAEMDSMERDQHCQTEPEARIMRSGRDGMVLGYNLQSAVDADSGLIVHHELTQDGGDSRQLLPLALATKAVLEAETLDVVADTGYSNAEHLDACEREGITATVPRSLIPGSPKEFYQKSDFTYEAEQDRYICPAGESLHHTGNDKHRNLKLYTRTGCSSCAQHSQCTRADKRFVSRSFYDDAIVRSNARLEANPRLMIERMTVVERPFAVLKHAMGLRRFVCRGKTQAETEISLAILGHNLKRMMSIKGVPGMLELLS